MNKKIRSLVRQIARQSETDLFLDRSVAFSLPYLDAVAMTIGQVLYTQIKKIFSIISSLVSLKH